MSDRVESLPKQKTSSGVVLRTKGRIKGIKGNRKDRQHPHQPIFNDPLYEYLDNQVYNKEQHNFGPWVEMDKKSRDKKSRNKLQRNLPAIVHNQQNLQTLQYSHDYEQYIEHPQVQIPIFQRTNRVTSLRELRSVSLDLKPIQPLEPPKFRKQSVLSKQPFFTRSQQLINIKPFKSSLSLQKQSNFLFNRGFKQQEPKLLSLKLKHKIRTQSPYLKMKLGLNPQDQTEKRNMQLLKELKQHRLNKLK